MILVLMQFPRCLCSYVCFFLLFPPKELKVLQDNAELQNVLSQFQMPTMQYGTIRIAGFGETE